MKSYPVPFNEPARMAEVDSLSSVDVGRDPTLNEIVAMVRDLLDVPSALVSIVDQDKQWFAARDGFPFAETAKDYSICAHTILSPDPLVVCDTHADPRFEAHPVVINDPKIRFYAGAPIVLSSGFRVGSLCALDYVPRDHPTDQSIKMLQRLARITARVLDDIVLSRANTDCATLSAGETAKSAFIALIGHELRTPLTILVGGLKLVEAMSGKDVNKRLVSSTLNAATHLSGLVETIIAYSDVSTGDLRLNEKTYDLDQLLTNAAKLTLPGSNGGLKEVFLSDDLLKVTIYIDREQILLAINALLLNAMNHGGRDITLGSHLNDQGDVEIHVTDDGELGDHLELADLYEPFVVGGHLETRGTGGGLGLGLPLTLKLVELHGGEFEVMAEKNRTVAIIRLPSWRLKAS